MATCVFIITCTIFEAFRLSLLHMAWVTIMAAMAGLSQPLLLSTSTHAWTQIQITSSDVAPPPPPPIPHLDESDGTAEDELRVLTVLLQLRTQLDPTEVGLNTDTRDT